MGDYRIGSWKYMDGCFYVVVNSGGTIEKHGPVRWYKRLWLELLECMGKPKSISEVREFIQ